MIIMDKSICVAVFVFVSVARSVCGQGTFQITFDGPPVQPQGTAALVTNYSEAGISLKPVSADGRFIRVGANPVAFRPDNGSAYIQFVSGPALMFSFTNGSVFNLTAVDLAEYSTVVPDAVTVHFVGYRQDGSTVTADLTTDGIIDGTGPLADFETFTFGPEFSGLTRVEIPTYGWSLDNLVVTIPEPSTWALLLLGGAMVVLRKHRRD